MEYLVEPELIDFDDDILFCLCSLLKKAKQITPTMQKVFPYLPKFQIKYKGIFGHLLQALNYYVYYGSSTMFSESRDNLGLLFDMANISLFNKTPPIMLSNNMEGALLYQYLLQNLEGALV